MFIYIIATIINFKSKKFNKSQLSNLKNYLIKKKTTMKNKNIKFEQKTPSLNSHYYYHSNFITRFLACYYYTIAIYQ